MGRFVAIGEPARTLRSASLEGEDPTLSAPDWGHRSGPRVVGPTGRRRPGFEKIYSILHASVRY
ncbi:hypothetical protein CP556_03915 [Natrinema sp. CBA1119]|nr:hypothetical protein CP556_03915 [Natrinema sp. CBA1119]